MTKDIRSAEKIKYDGGSDSKGKSISTRAASSSGATTSDTSGLRRSGRNTASEKNMAGSPSAIRKSDRPEKLPSTSPITSKPDGAEATDMSTPLRRSERGKKLFSSSSPDSRKSGSKACSADTKHENDLKGKFVQLINESKVVSEDQNEKSVQDKKRNLPASYSYKALFKHKRKKVQASDNSGDLDGTGKLLQGSDGGTERSQVEREVSGATSLKVAHKSTVEQSNSGATECKKEKLENCELTNLSHATHVNMRVDRDLAEEEDHSCNAKSNEDFRCTSLNKDRSVPEDAATTGLGENLDRHMEHNFPSGGKSETPRFIEFWVPVQISEIQLEQYCSTLLSNALSLCSSSRNDPFGALRNTLVSIRKCCDHPYVIDQDLQLRLTKGLKEVEILDVGIGASGKLQLLDAILKEIKLHCLKAVVLFQSIGGAGRDLIGDILDDFMRQRFGPTSYERVERDLVSSKKQCAVNKFVNESGRFVLLLETRACNAAIKLSAVDAFIIFDSDWNPLNDLRALQKITLDPKSAQTKVFRLYSSCTVEEKLLILAKEKKSVDNSLQSINVATTHMLLMWGALYLFNKLEEFHNSPYSSTHALFQQSFLKDVVHELSLILLENDRDNDTSKSSLVLEAKCNREAYTVDFPLFGQQKVKLMDEERPQLFWTKLVDGKNPKWKYCSVIAQRNRKRVQQFGDWEENCKVDDGEVVKKRRKVVGSIADSISRHDEPVTCRRGQKGASGSPARAASQSSPRSASGTADTIYGSTEYALNSFGSNIRRVAEDMFADNDAGKNLRESQKGVYVSLKQDVAKLCEVLHLSEETSAIAVKFLQYVLDHHHVIKKPATTLEAFQISVCWVAVSLLKHKIDHKKSLSVAREHLNFECRKEEADYIYSMLRCMKGLFMIQTQNVKMKCPAKDFERSTKADGQEESDTGVLQGTFHHQKENQLAQNDLSRSLRDIKKKCQKKMEKLLQKQKEEREEVEQEYIEKRVQLEQMKKVEVAVIRLHGNAQMKMDKVKKSDAEFERKLEELACRRDTRLKDLEAKHSAETIRMKQKEECWIQRIRSWAELELVNPAYKHSIPNVHSHTHVDGPQCNDLVPSEIHENTHDLMCSDSDTVTPCSESGAMVSRRAQAPGPSKCSSAGGLGGDQDNVLFPDPPCEVQNTSVVIPAVSKIATTKDTGEDLIPMASSDQQIVNGATHDKPENSVLVPDPPCEAQNTLVVVPAVSDTATIKDTGVDLISAASLDQQICSGATHDKPENNVLFTDPPCEVRNTSVVVPAVSEVATTRDTGVDLIPAASSHQQICNGAPHNKPEDAGGPDTACTAECAENTETLSPPFPCDHVPGGAASPVLDEGVSLSVPKNVQSDASVWNAPSAISPSVSTENQFGDAAVIDDQNISEQYEPPLAGPVDCVPYDQFSSEAQAVGTGIQEQPSSSSCDPLSNDLPADTACMQQPSNENVATSQPAETLVQQHMGNHVQVPHQSAVQPQTSSAGIPPVDIPADSSYPHLSDPGTIPSIPLPSNIRTQGAAPPTPLNLNRDPLQNELDRVRGEMGKGLQNHEETKVKLKSERDKEIARISSKYESQLRQVESEFLTKRKELETYENKVLMNKILAETFRAKCLLGKASASPRTLQDVASGFMQQVLSPQNRTQRPLTSPICTTVTPTAAAAPPPATGPITPPPRYPSFPIDSTPNPQARPLYMNHRPSPALNPHRANGLRAPAPHLQPFRPSSSASPSNNLSSHPRDLLTQPPSNRHLSWVPQSAFIYGRTSQPQPARDRFSALELLFDMTTQAGANRNTPSNSASSPNPVQPQHSADPIPVQPSGGPDIVCLSDDDD